MKLKYLTQAALFAALIAIAAQLRFPFILGIPITFQTLFVLLAALYLPSPYGTKSILLYLITGLIGFPVFSGGGGGPAWLMGPTGGFLFGFIPAVFIIQKKRHFWLSGAGKTALSLLIGIFIIYSCGIIWFAVVSEKTIKSVLPLFTSFLPGESIKMLMAWLFIRRELNNGNLPECTIKQKLSLPELERKVARCQ